MVTGVLTPPEIGSTGADDLKLSRGDAGEGSSSEEATEHCWVSGGNERGVCKGATDGEIERVSEVSEHKGSAEANRGGLSHFGRRSNRTRLALRLLDLQV
jgi:hypothetical protein